MTPHYWSQAQKELSLQDPRLAELFARFPSESLVSKKDPFETLLRSILGQQISVKAAATITGRLLELVEVFAPDRILSLEIKELRSAGLSERKAEYAIELSREFLVGDFAGLDFSPLDDDEVIARLVRLRGIGRWTAEMFLMFHLLRPNVFPVQDIGLLRGISKHFDLPYTTDPKAVDEFKRRWHPWNSVATWYLWRSLDPIPVIY